MLKAVVTLSDDSVSPAFTILFMLGLIFLAAIILALAPLIIPRYLFPLYFWVCLVLYSVSSFPSSYPNYDTSGADAFGEAMLYLTIYGVILVAVFNYLLRRLIQWLLFRYAPTRKISQAYIKIQ